MRCDPKLKATWDNNRPDLHDQSSSGYIMAISQLLLGRHKFTQQEVEHVIKTWPHLSEGKAKRTDSAWQGEAQRVADKYQRSRSYSFTNGGVNAEGISKENVRVNKDISPKGDSDDIKNNVELLPITERIGDYWSQIELSQQKETYGFLTGCKAIDRVQRGFRGLCYLVGMEKSHKSTLAMTMALEAVSQGFTVVYSDLENGGPRFLARIISNMSDSYTYNEIMLKDDKNQMAKQYAMDLRNDLILKNLYLVESGLGWHPVNDMDRVVQRMEELHASNKDIVWIVDSLHKLANKGAFDRRLEMDQISHALEKISRGRSWLTILGILEGTIANEKLATKESRQFLYDANIVMSIDRVKFKEGEKYDREGELRNFLEVKLIASRDCVGGISAFYRIGSPYHFRLQECTREEMDATRSSVDGSGEGSYDSSKSRHSGARPSPLYESKVGGGEWPG